MKEFWDSHVHLSVAELIPEQQSVLLHCGDLHGRSVLELGCGSASLARACADKAARVVAVDTSQNVIDRSRALPGAAKVSFVCSDVLDLDLGEEFDLIIGSSFLHEVPLTSFPLLIDVLDSCLAPGGRIIFAENSFFNPVFRFVRRNLVDTGILRKMGSFDETPFDEARYRLLAQRFPRTTRRIDNFVLFKRALDQFAAHKRGLAWTARVGPHLDNLGGRLKPTGRLAKAWSYQQIILAER